jgi:hypothetical protein
VSLRRTPLLASATGGSAAEGLSHRRTSFRCGTTEAYGTIQLVTRLAVLPLLVGVVVAAGCGSTHRAASSGTTATSTLSTATAAATPRCTSSNLAVWLGLGEGGGTAGSTYYPLELSNISNHVCHLRGFPGVSAWRGHLLGSPAQRSRTGPDRTVTLLPGETAHTVLQIADVDNFSRSRCVPVTAFGLKVIPPDETASAGVPFNFPACSKAGPVFLSVRAVEAGVGIPGHSG